jgi:Predicted membrane protein (DUF2142)
MGSAVKLAWAGGLALLALGVALTLSGSPVRVLATNDVPLQGELTTLHGAATVCQPEGELPHGVAGIRLGLESAIGPRVTVVASSGRRVLARGASDSGWEGADMTVPLHYGGGSVPGTILCVSLETSPKSVLVIGAASGPRIAAASGGESLGGRMRVEYLAPGRRSWWSQALAVARRLGLGRAPSGTWVGGLILALMLAVVALASALCLRGPTGKLRGLPAAAWVCAAIALLNAAAWSVLTPPFQLIDEPSHFAYVQQLAEAHSLPHLPNGPGETFSFSPEEETALSDLHQSEVQFLPSEPTIGSRAQQDKLEHDLARRLSRRGPGYAGVATSEPPLYYALEAIPYELASSGSLLDRLELMRLCSSLFAALTALFAFMFVRETLPRASWAWTIGGLTVALAPLLAFVSGGVNPEGMLYAVSAALLYALARAFRRGLTPRLAAAVCALIVLGLLTKLNFLGLVPGALLGLALLVRRASPRSRRIVLRAAGAALALVAVALVAAFALGSLSGNASVSIVSGSLSRDTGAANLLGELSYTWQLFLPRLPGMTDYFPGVSAPLRLWFDGLVGRYGWSDTVFPSWVYGAALFPAGLVALLVLRALVDDRLALRRRAGELAVYATMALGLLTIVGFASYGHDGTFWEPRYLLPLLPLFGAAIALAARGAGRRYGPLAVVAIVVLVLAHDLFSQLLMVSRYYA